MSAWSVSSMFLLLLCLLAVWRWQQERRAQGQLRHDLERARLELAIKSRMIAHVNHEIRTPMNAIFGYSGLLHDRLQDPMNCRYIDAINTSARSLLRVINDLLEFSRLEAGKIEVHATPTHLREQLDAVVALFLQRAVSREIVLSVDLDEAMPEMLMLDADRLRQMLINLVDNAIKHTEHGRVAIVVRALPSERAGCVNCLLDVDDSGTGIAQEDRDQIFEPFAQGGRRTGLDASGTGLGLSISRQLAHSLGWQLSLLDKSTAGARFRIEMRDVPIASQLEPSHEDDRRLQDLPTLRVLTVDDIALNRQVLVSMFTDTGHQVLVASGGREALELAIKERPDVMLIDVRMPDIDGITLARLLRGNEHTRRIILVGITAARLAADDPDRALFDGFIFKPFHAGILARELSRLIPREPSAGHAHPAETGLHRPSLRALCNELEVLLTEVWPGVRDALMIHEVRDLSLRLARLGERHHYQRLNQYARRLAVAAANFDVVQIEFLLAKFPGEVMEIKRADAAEAETLS